MTLLDLLDRVYSVMDKLDPKHPNVKKVNKVLATAEKALLAGAKIIGIKIDDIKEIKNVKPDDTKDKPGGDKAEENGDAQDSNKSPEEENIEGPENENPQGDDDKKMKIKMMFGKLPADKQDEFKNKMGDKFNSLGL